MLITVKVSSSKLEETWKFIFEPVSRKLHKPQPHQSIHWSRYGSIAFYYKTSLLVVSGSKCCSGEIFTWTWTWNCGAFENMLVVHMYLTYSTVFNVISVFSWLWIVIHWKSIDCRERRTAARFETQVWMNAERVLHSVLLFKLISRPTNRAKWSHITWLFYEDQNIQWFLTFMIWMIWMWESNYFSKLAVLHFLF